MFRPKIQPAVSHAADNQCSTIWEYVLPFTGNVVLSEAYAFL